MAQSKIPFDFFFERYYPEHNFVGAIDMTKIHSEQEYAVAMNAFFDMIYAVTLEDIQGLTDEELNCVPTPWLYDWLHCHMGEGEEFIEELQKKRKNYKNCMQLGSAQRARARMRRYETFTFQEVQEDLSLSYDRFLAIVYNLIIQGIVRYQDGYYKKLNK